MKIAVCDDELCDLQQITEFLDRYNPNLNISVFSSAEDLLHAFLVEFYDLIFMDLEMDNISGFDASIQLMASEHKPLIIFTTKSSAYSIRGYGIAFRYLMKPITYEMLEEAVSLALENLAPKKIDIFYDGIKQILFIDDISFFEVFNHSTVVHTKTAQFTIYCPLSEIMTKLKDCNFAQPHKSFFVNLSYVDRIGIDQIILSTGDQIRLSRDKKKLFNKLLMSYLRK